MNKNDKLHELYHQTSKHSNYQIVASALEKYIPNSHIDVTSRNEKSRLTYFLDTIDIKEKKLLDIGGNTGYFTFEFLTHGAFEVDYYEGNKAHALFVQEAANVLSLSDKLTVNNRYFLFDDTTTTYDVIFLLNVLHHVGDDYGDDTLSKEKALETITSSLQALANKTDTLVFQLGFNWKGDCNLPLFENGTKKEMIDFVETAIKGYFKITEIGIAEETSSNITYHALNKYNIERKDELGEFLNRPIFVMKSLKN